MTDDRIDRRTRNSRDEILDAAEAVVRENGANHLTIDAVARVSGFSKGGVLYNFPSKQALLEGMVDRAIEKHEAVIDEAREAATDPNPTLKAVLASCKFHRDKQPVARAFLAATAENPVFVDKFRTLSSQRYRQITSEAADVEQALIVWLAFEGMMLLDALDFSVIPKQARQRVERRLQRMSEQ